MEVVAIGRWFGLSIPLLAGMLLGLAAGSATAVDRHDLQRQPGRTEYCLIYLKSVCDDLDCFFTVERLLDPQNGVSAFGDPIVDVKDVASTNELIQHLRSQLKGIKVTSSTVTTPQGKRTVIHLIQRSLSRQRENPLNQTLDLRMAGTLEELLIQLKQQTGNIGSITRGGFFPLPYVDLQTQTCLDIEHRKGRDILTRAVLRPGYNRLLWIANIYDDAEGRQAEILFQGLDEKKTDSQ